MSNATAAGFDSQNVLAVKRTGGEKVTMFFVFEKKQLSS
jgi:hypothetical protein